MREELAPLRRDIKRIEARIFVGDDGRPSLSEEVAALRARARPAPRNFRALGAIVAAVVTSAGVVLAAVLR